MYLFLFHGTPAHTRHMPSKLIIHSCRNCVQLHNMQKIIQSLKNRSDRMTKQAALHLLLALKTIGYLHHCTKVINDQSSIPTKICLVLQKHTYNQSCTAKSRAVVIIKLQAKQRRVRQIVPLYQHGKDSVSHC
jgi:hypothetical protein